MISFAAPANIKLSKNIVIVVKVNDELAPSVPLSKFLLASLFTIYFFIIDEIFLEEISIG
jgi:hypothetical protein